MTISHARPDTPKALETGIPIIDEEHRRLREFLDGLRALCVDFDSKRSCAGCPDEKIGACETALLDGITELLGYMIEHFRREEDLMKSFGLNPQQREHYLQHAEDHANITQQVADLTRSRPRQETVRTLAETASVVSRWLDAHITHHDVPMLK